MTACIGLIALSTACDDFLDLEPKNTPVGEAYWETEADANSAVLGGYYKLRETLRFGGGLNFFTYGDFPAQIWESGRWAQNPFKGIYIYDGNGELSDWSPFYKVILAANVAIKNIADMPENIFSGGDSKRNSYIGEALFIRAFTYFYMTRIWGEVPLILDPIEDASGLAYDVPLATEEQLLKQCLEDLTLANSYLTWKYTAGAINTRANKGSVNALMAHIYMWNTRANKSTIDTKDFERAIACCDSIEQEGPYELVSAENYLSIWKGKSIEGIFEFPFDAAQKEMFSKNQGFVDRFLGYPYVNELDMKNLGPIFIFSQDFFNLYSDPNDLRTQYLFENFNNRSQCFTLKYNQIQYTNTEKTDWVTDNNVVIFRLADIYLLRAEAYAKLGEYDKAIKYLDRVRVRAGTGNYTGSTDRLYMEIGDERERELFLEGHRLYDWVRTGFYYQKSSVYSQSRYMEEGYLWPVNYRLLSANKYARQTPYWADKMQN